MSKMKGVIIARYGSQLKGHRDWIRYIDKDDQIALVDENLVKSDHHVGGRVRARTATREDGKFSRGHASLDEKLDARLAVGLITVEQHAQALKRLRTREDKFYDELDRSLDMLEASRAENELMAIDLANDPVVQARRQASDDQFVARFLTYGETV